MVGKGVSKMITIKFLVENFFMVIAYFLLFLMIIFIVHHIKLRIRRKKDWMPSENGLEDLSDYYK